MGSLINLKSRRGFIKLGALGTAATVLPFSQLTGNAKKEELVRVGVIGTGNRGMGLIDLINRIDGLEVVACADVIPFRLEVGLAQAEKAKGYTNHADLLGDKNVDAVLICTPFSMHGQMAIDALQAGKHVYCEKAMVKGVPEIQAVIDQYRKSDLVFQTGHQYHSSALYNKTRQIIQSGYIGDVTAIHCQWNRNGSWRRPVPDPKWERMINWRMYLEYSGGLVAELMSHQIDFINWVTQSLPSHFTGFGGIDHWKDGRETYDNVHLLMKYPSGLDASLTCTTTNGYDDYKIKILGSRATIIMDYANAAIYMEKMGEEEMKGLVDGVSGATLQQWQSGKGVPIDANGSAPTLQALTQFYESIAKGTPVASDIQTGANTAKVVKIANDAIRGGAIRNWGEYPELKFN